MGVFKENTAIKSLQHSVSMMNDFINATLIELTNAQKAGQTELLRSDLTSCSSRKIIKNTVEAYPLPGNVIIHQDVSYDFFLKGNSILIMKILFNLIKNAVEQIVLHGRGEIIISTEELPGYNLLKIKDTAGGASPDVVDKFFQAYFTTKKGRTGIGLAYAKKNMNLFGGDLTYYNIYGII